MKETKTGYTINGTEFEQVIADNGITQTITSRPPGMPTAAEIIAEPAGRRMDKWVAEYVLKEKPPDGYEILPDGSYELEEWDFKIRSVTYWQWPPMYSDNIAVAFYALENIGEVLYWDLLHQYNRYVFEIVYSYLGEHYCRAKNCGDTKALAICRALLTLFCVEIQ